MTKTCLMPRSSRSWSWSWAATEWQVTAASTAHPATRGRREKGDIETSGSGDRAAGDPNPLHGSGRAPQLLRPFVTIHCCGDVMGTLKNARRPNRGVVSSLYRPGDPNPAMRPIPAFVTAALALSVAAPALAASPAPKDPRIAGAYTFQRGGWTYVHLEGSPEQIGFQHGYLLAPEIADALHVFKVEDEHTTQRDWQFFRDASQKMFWPHIDAEYQAELRGIAEGAQARGI